MCNSKVTFKQRTTLIVQKALSSPYTVLIRKRYNSFMQPLYKTNSHIWLSNPTAILHEKLKHQTTEKLRFKNVDKHI